MTENENCPNCGCGFLIKDEDGGRTCLYCPHRWNIKDMVNTEDPKSRAGELKR